MNTKTIIDNFSLSKIKVEKLGTDNIQDFFTELLRFLKDVKELQNKWNLGNAIQLVFKLAKYGALIPVFKQAVKEFKDLDATEIEGLEIFLRDEVDFENKNLEAVIEEAISLIIDGKELIENAIPYYIRIKEFFPLLKTIRENKELTARIRT